MDKDDPLTGTYAHTSGAHLLHGRSNDIFGSRETSLQLEGKGRWLPDIGHREEQRESTPCITLRISETTHKIPESSSFGCSTVTPWGAEMWIVATTDATKSQSQSSARNIPGHTLLTDMNVSKLLRLEMASSVPPPKSEHYMSDLFLRLFKELDVAPIVRVIETFGDEALRIHETFRIVSHGPV